MSGANYIIIFFFYGNPFWGYTSQVAPLITTHYPEIIRRLAQLSPHLINPTQRPLVRHNPLNGIGFCSFSSCRRFDHYRSVSRLCGQVTPGVARLCSLAPPEVISETPLRTYLLLSPKFAGRPGQVDGRKIVGKGREGRAVSNFCCTAANGNLLKTASLTFPGDQMSWLTR